ncbi:MAG: glutamate 5-kinase [Candidatus Methylacidiphilales bacterium]|nr:glutamate 5-kinase [Candidatus Methylacidiphilales bacterium]
MKKRRPELWVVKLGSGLLTNSRGGTDQRQIAELCRQIHALRGRGIQVVLVSSGAISAGMSALGLDKRPKDRPTLQACASIGQPLLMRAYASALQKHGMVCAQILITSWDMDSRKVYQNAQNTLARLLALGHCLPIFNENDALSFEEIEMLNRFGDNDRLSGHVALLSGADRLVILSGIDGLNTKPDGSGQWVRRVHEIDDRIRGFAGSTSSERSVGGMISKLETARMMLQSGVPMWIADGRMKNILLDIAAGKPRGTCFKK